MRKLLDRTYLLAGGLAACCVLAICVLMLAQTVLRETGYPTGAINDIVAWLCAAGSFLAMAHAFKHGDFVRVTLVIEKLSPRWQHRLDAVCLVIGTVAIGYLAYWAAKFAYESWEINDMANGLLAIPMWIPQMSFVVGALLFLVAMVDELVRVLRGARPTYVTAVEERHAHGDFSSDV